MKENIVITFGVVTGFLSIAIYISAALLIFILSAPHSIELKLISLVFICLAIVIGVFTVKSSEKLKRDEDSLNNWKTLAMLFSGPLSLIVPLAFVLIKLFR